MQRRLCKEFGEKFPWRTATLHIGGKAYDEFGDMPFLDGAPEGVCEVKFEDTTDVYWIDVHHRDPEGKKKGLEEEMNPQVQQPLAVIPDFPIVAPWHERAMV